MAPFVHSNAPPRRRLQIHHRPQPVGDVARRRRAQFGDAGPALGLGRDAPELHASPDRRRFSRRASSRCETESPPEDTKDTKAGTRAKYPWCSLVSCLSSKPENELSGAQVFGLAAARRRRACCADTRSSAAGCAGSNSRRRLRPASPAHPMARSPWPGDVAEPQVIESRGRVQAGHDLVTPFDRRRRGAQRLADAPAPSPPAGASR